jgi:hypothetical protein
MVPGKSEHPDRWGRGQDTKASGAGHISHVPKSLQSRAVGWPDRRKTINQVAGLSMGLHFRWEDIVLENLDEEMHARQENS